jgi:hypothetical protein
VRVDQPLSSDRSYGGEVFTSTLIQPLVVDGFVVARPGQIVAGHVAEAERAGRASGTSRLGLELTEISLVDGQQLPVLTQWIEYEGPTSVGNDVATVATVTGVGAAIGAAVDGGFGAGMGALAGAAASAIGVLATRGKPTEVYPESVLTFRTLSPLVIWTDRSAQAFLPVTQADYDRRVLERRVRPRRAYYAPPAHVYFEYRPRRTFYRPRVVVRPVRPVYVYPRVFAPRIVIAPRGRPRVAPRVVVRPRHRPHRGEGRGGGRRR